MSALIESGKTLALFGSLVMAAPLGALANQKLHVEKHIHGSHEECPLPKSSSDVMDCAVKLHPSSKRARLKVDSIGNLEKKALQIPNPTFSSRYVKGEHDSEEVSELETNLSFTLELGGKRSSRQELAKGEINNAIAEKEAVKANVKIETVLKMHRLRQVLEERKLLEESLVAFKNVLKKLEDLPRLSAEQEASLTLFELALEEAKVHKSELFEIERELEHFFHVATGHSLDEIAKVLPPAPTSWPSVNDKEAVDVSPNVKRLESLAQLAQKEYELQGSNAWPDLKIGPSFSIEKEGGRENEMLGFNIQLPLPLFQANGGAKAYAKSELLRSQQNIALTKSEEKHERFEKKRVYESAVSILQKTMKMSTVEKKHKRIANLYMRGVVSSSVYLDSIKQKLSYLKRRNMREMTAIKALWAIRFYDGSVLKEKM